MIWAVLGERAGDNASVLALCEALQLPFEVKQVMFNHKAMRLSLMSRRSIKGVSNSEIFNAALPEVVVSSGIKNEPVVRYLKKKKPAIKIVYVGRTWAKHKYFDIIVSTPQYRLSGENIKVFPLPPIPLSKLTNAIPAPPEYSPKILVSIGGNVGPYILNEDTIHQMMINVCEYALEKNATLYVTTSARTPQELIPCIVSHLTSYDFFYVWQPNDSSNPYWHWLQSADEIIVTSDSVSMLADAVAAQKHTYVYDINVDSIDSHSVAWVRAKFYYF
jgi:mitochondrial fission protein ELM1